jgi:hypothetical protein
MVDVEYKHEGCGYDNQIDFTRADHISIATLHSGGSYEQARCTPTYISTHVAPSNTHNWIWISHVKHEAQPVSTRETSAFVSAAA